MTSPSRISSKRSMCGSSSSLTALIARRRASSPLQRGFKFLRVARRIRRTWARSNRWPSQCSQKLMANSLSRTAAAALVVLVVCLSACAKRIPALAPEPPPAARETQEGLASFYGEEFNGRTTASGRPFDMNAMVAAHPRYPFGTLVRVTNLANGRSVEVRIEDRGPARQLQAEGVIIDLSRRAAETLGFVQQ